jgi:monofunctional biosynthetic peptidoglycan transglycosylase
VRRILRRLVLGFLAAGAASVLWLLFVWPPPSWWRTHWPSETAFMRMRAGRLATAGDTTARRYHPVPLDSISDWLARAVTAAEDDTFFQHHGIDWNALRQALGYRQDGFDWRREPDRAELRRAFGHAYERRDRLRGASTITQQLAKNLYLSPSRNPLRKVKEAAIAYRLEWALSKERILALYLNVAELGNNVWGVEAASRTYFDRSAARVSMEQAALLVATLPHPRSSNPAYRPGRARWRQQLILRRLRGEPVALPDEPEEELPGVMADTVPASMPLMPDSAPAVPPNDSAAAPPKDTTAVPVPAAP